MGNRQKQVEVQEQTVVQPQIQQPPPPVHHKIPPPPLNPIKRYLEIKSQKYDQILSQLSYHQGIQMIQILDDCRNLSKTKALEAVSTCQRIKILELTIFPGNIQQALIPISRMSNLTLIKLTLQRDYYDLKINLQPLKTLQNLQRLIIINSNASITSKNIIQCIPKLNNLSALLINLFSLPPQVIRNLNQNINSLNELVLFGCLINIRLIIQLSPIFRNVKILNLSSNQIRDLGCKQILKFHQLQQLTLKNCGITDLGLLYLSNLRKVKLIYLKNNYVSRPMVKRAMWNWRHIKDLNVFIEKSHILKSSQNFFKITSNILGITNYNFI